LRLATAAGQWSPDHLPLATSDTKLIAINNPNNPTGALMDRAFLEQLVAIAREQGAWLLSDEVYRGIAADDAEPTP
jgi:aspartate/methionine/tyrosine aminotransferase